MRPLAIVVGFIGKSPLAGMTLYNLHHVLGLQELGYDVHYVERQNTTWDCYDPDAGLFTDDASYALHYLADTLARFAGIQPNSFSFVDLEGRCHGSGWRALRVALDRADFVLTIEDVTRSRWNRVRRLAEQLASGGLTPDLRFPTDGAERAALTDEPVGS